MPKIILILLLAAASNSAMAEWIEVGSNDTDTVYIDPATIRGTDALAKMWALNDFKETQVIDNRAPFKSVKMEYEYDCKEELSRMLYFTSHPANMAEGEVLDFNFAPSAWTRSAPGSVLDAMWKIACGKT